MTNSYRFNDKSQLTPHFNVSEFRCKCGGNHDTIINPELPEKLEQLYKNLDCSKIIINSGYRCSQHDKTVGGSGGGHHVYGNAVDIVCYDKGGKIISSKKVSCVAQDIGFGGIANIDSSYTATHVDVRQSNFWKGDEVKTSSYSVTDDFYKYYGLSKSDIQTKKTKNISLTIDNTVYVGVLTEK